MTWMRPARLGKKPTIFERPKAHSGQRLPQVPLQILPIFDADAESYQPVVNAPRLANLRGNTGMCHGRRVADERFDATEALGQAEKPGSGQQLEGRLFAALEAD